MNMKRHLLSLLLVASALLPAKGWANELTTYRGTEKNYNVPINGLYCDAYLKAEYIMEADSLVNMANNYITSMTFYLQTANRLWGDVNFTIFMKEVPYTTLDAYTGHADATIVYQGRLDGRSSIMEIGFSAPYFYSGGNLLIGFYLYEFADYSSTSFYGATATGASIQGYSYYDMDHVSCNQRNFVPMTTFGYGASVCPPPTGLSVSNVTHDGASLSWQAAGDEDEWLFQYKKLEDYTWTDSIVTTTNILLDWLAPNTDYEARVKVRCDNSVFSNMVNFHTDYHFIVIDASHSLTDDFEGNSPVLFVNGRQYSKWQVGTAAHYSGDKALYISSDDGISNNYSSSRGSTCYAMYSVQLVQGTYRLQYDWRSTGFNPDAHYSIFLTPMPASLNAGDSYSGNKAYLVENQQWSNLWQHHSSTTQIEQGGQYLLVFMWENTAGAAINPPIAIDNVQFSLFDDCLQPTNLVANLIGETEASLSWMAGGDEAEWQLVYGTDASLDPDSATPISLDTTYCQLTELVAETSYHVFVRSKSSGNTYSQWTSATFTTFAEGMSRVEIGNETQAIFNLPFVTSNRFSVSEQIYMASEIGTEGTLSEISFYYTGQEAMTANIFLLLAHTQKTAFEGPNDYIIFTDDDQYFSGNVTLPAQPGWVSIPLRSPFVYNGTDNLVVCINNVTDVAGAYRHFSCSAAPENTSLYNVDDWIAFSPQSAIYTSGARLSLRNNIRLLFDNNSCFAPNIYSASINSNSADINWRSGSETEWNLRYQTVTSDIYDFEDHTFQGWTQIDADGDGRMWAIESEYPCFNVGAHNASSDCLLSVSWDVCHNTEVDPDNYLVSPQMTLGGTMTVFARPLATNYYSDHFGIAVSVEGNTDPNDFVMLNQWTLNSTAEYTPYTIDLSAYEGLTGYVAIRHFNSYDNYGIAIDDIMFQTSSGNAWTEVNGITTKPYNFFGLQDNTPYQFQVQAVCGPDKTSEWSDIFSLLIGHLEAVQITASSATMLWSSLSSSISSWQVGLSNYADSIPAHMRTIDTTSATFTGLDEETLYYGWVGINNRADNHQWVKATFVTLPAVEQVEPSLIMSSAVHLSWVNNDPDVSLWEIGVSTSSSEPPVSVIEASSTSAYINGLQASTDYVAWVRAKYGEDDYSRWATTPFSTITTIEQFSATSVSASSAHFSWISNDPDAVAWELGTSLSDQVPPISVTTVTDTIGLAADLQASTDYVAWVRAKYGDGSYSSWTTYPFHTPCEPMLIDTENPFVEHFENTDALRCWNNDIAPYSYYVSASSELTITQSTSVDLPPMRISEGLPILSFRWKKTYNYSYLTVTNVTGSDIVFCDTIWTDLDLGNNMWQQTELELTPYVGRDIAIHFIFQKINSTGRNYLDDISVATYDNVLTTAGDWNTTSNWATLSLPQPTDHLALMADVDIPSGCVAHFADIDRRQYTITVEDGGQLVTEQEDLSVTMKKNVAGYGSTIGNWHFLAFPFDWAGNSVIAPNSVAHFTDNDFDCYSFLESGLWSSSLNTCTQWLNIKNFYSYSSFPMASGQGFLYANSNDVELSCSGIVISQKDPISLSHTNNGMIGQLAGFHLIGNPYPCNANIGSDDFYVCNGRRIVLATDGTIAPCTGIMVYVPVGGASVTFDKGDYVEPQRGNTTTLTLYGEDGLVEDLVKLKDTDSKAVAKYRNQMGSDLFFNAEDKEYAMLPTPSGKPVKLCFVAEKDGRYTLSAKVSGAAMTLVDQLTGNEIKLTDGTTYPFEAKTTDAKDRFLIRY